MLNSLVAIEELENMNFLDNAEFLSLEFDES